jgi:hypothetical protein
LFWEQFWVLISSSHSKCLQVLSETHGTMNLGLSLDAEVEKSNLVWPENEPISTRADLPVASTYCQHVKDQIL